MLDAFDWNADKAIINLAKHWVSFSRAALAFQDPFALHMEDLRKDYQETRCILIGRAKNHLLYVAYTERGEKIRIISARRANENERTHYYRENAEGRHSDTHFP